MRYIRASLFVARLNHFPVATAELMNIKCAPLAETVCVTNRIKKSTGDLLPTAGRNGIKSERGDENNTERAAALKPICQWVPSILVVWRISRFRFLDECRKRQKIHFQP